MFEMSDGVRLAASLWFPEDEGPWPALLEALPYRKDDVTASYAVEYERLSDAGYAVCRVDVRGTGSSEGIAEDEYPVVERTDLAAVIDRLATATWSTGAVGMFGTSYSGFNSIQLASERPAGLKAIIPIFASDDRYADDVHYFGGALKQLDLIDYPAYMVALNALPPVPSVYGPGWREEWARRVEGSEPWLLTWLSHQRYDDYWKFGSLIEDAGAIDVPTMLVAGWADGYTNISLRTFEGLTCPRRLLLGPWAHADVANSLPGPGIDLVPEMLRWWDRWLKGVDTGVDDEPPIIVYAQRSTRPDPVRREVRGSWRYEPTWPAERLRPTPFRLADSTPGGLARPDALAPTDRPGGAEPGADLLPIRGDVGATAWISCAGSLPWGQSSDQRPDEQHSLTYTWGPFDHEVELLGHPRLHIRVRSSEPVAFVSAKVCDVFPDGTSSLVVRGMSNLTHRDSREEPAPLEPGRTYDVAFDLEACSWTFERGHRIRLDLAPADWPNAWAPPSAGTLEIDRGSGVLELPVLEGPSPVATTPALRPAPTASSDPADAAGITWALEEAVIARERRALAGSTFDEPAVSDVPSMAGTSGGAVGVSIDDPGRAWAAAESSYEIRFPEATCTTVSTLRVDSDGDTYRVAIELVVSEDGRERWRRRWDRRFPRDLQ